LSLTTAGICISDDARFDRATQGIADGVMLFGLALNAGHHQNNGNSNPTASQGQAASFTIQTRPRVFISHLNPIISRIADALITQAFFAGRQLTWIAMNPYYTIHKPEWKCDHLRQPDGRSKIRSGGCVSGEEMPEPKCQKIDATVSALHHFTSKCVRGAPHSEHLQRKIYIIYMLSIICQPRIYIHNST
jgi:hypothetical protein